MADKYSCSFCIFRYEKQQTDMLCQPAAVTVADPDQNRGAGQYGLIPGQNA